MMRTRFVMLLAALALLAPFATASAQGETSYPLAAISGGNVYLYGFGDAPQQVTESPAQNTLSMAWSPNGQYLALTRWDENYALALWVYDRQAGGAPVQVASGLISGLPVTFSADNQLVYAVDTGQFEQTDGGAGGSIAGVYTLDPAVGTPQQIGTLTFGVGCGGGSSSRADWRYWAEAGTGPGFTWRPSSLEVLRVGLLRMDVVLSGQALRPTAAGEECSIAGDHCRLYVDLDVSVRADATGARELTGRS